MTTAAPPRGPRVLRRGCGIAGYFENTASYEDEQAKVHVSEDGRFSVFIGTQSNGQGHETSYAQIVARELDVPLEDIRLIQGDSDMNEHGHGTGGSRSLVMGGAAVKAASRKIADKTRQIAAHLLEAAEGDIDAVGRRVPDCRNRPRHFLFRSGVGGLQAVPPAARNGARALSK